jgi:hypothetical protein
MKDFENLSVETADILDLCGSARRLGCDQSRS